MRTVDRLIASGANHKLGIPTPLSPGYSCAVRNSGLQGETAPMPVRERQPKRRSRQPARHFSCLHARTLWRKRRLFTYRPEDTMPAGRAGERARFRIRRFNQAQPGRVGMWRGDVRSGMRVPASFVWRCPSGSTIAPFPHPAHRTGHADFPASGSRTRLHAFVHGTSCPSRVRRTSPKVS